VNWVLNKNVIRILFADDFPIPSFSQSASSIFTKENDDIVLDSLTALESW
jgi:hypothetical protein